MRFKFGERGLIAWPYATSESLNIGRDREAFRGPFGEVVRVAGVGTPRVSTVEVSVRLPELPPEPGALLSEVDDVLITEDGTPLGFTQFETLDGFVSEVEQAERLETEFWDARVATLTQVSTQQVTPGFRIDLAFVVHDEPQFAFVLSSEAGQPITTQNDRILEVNL